MDEAVGAGPMLETDGRDFNQRWGYLSRAGLNDKSQFTRQIEKYADIYTSRVSNFLRYTPYAYFRCALPCMHTDPHMVQRPLLRCLGRSHQCLSDWFAPANSPGSPCSCSRHKIRRCTPNMKGCIRQGLRPFTGFSRTCTYTTESSPRIRHPACSTRPVQARPSVHTVGRCN